METNKEMTKNEEMIDEVLRDESLSYDEKVSRLAKMKGQAFHQGREAGAPASKDDVRRVEQMLEKYGVPKNKPYREGRTPDRE